MRGPEVRTLGDWIVAQKEEDNPQHHTPSWALCIDHHPCGYACCVHAQIPKCALCIESLAVVCPCRVGIEGKSYDEIAVSSR